MAMESYNICITHNLPWQATVYRICMITHWVSLLLTLERDCCGCWCQIKPSDYQLWDATGVYPWPVTIYILYINIIILSIHYLKIHCYADDTFLYVPGPVPTYYLSCELNFIVNISYLLLYISLIWQNNRQLPHYLTSVLC